MRNEVIPILGMQIAPTDKNAPDGACQELINLRFKDGSHRKSGHKEEAFEINIAQNEYNAVYKHIVAPAGYFIGRRDVVGSTTTTTEFYYFNYSGSANQLISFTDEFKDIEFLGNFLIITTNVEKYIFRYLDNDFVIDTYSGQYSASSESTYPYLLLDELPLPAFNPNAAISGGVYTKQRQRNFLMASYTDAQDLIDDFIKWQYQQGVDGYICGNILYMMAYQLWDGSYIMYSKIFHPSSAGMLLQAPMYTDVDARAVQFAFMWQWEFITDVDILKKYYGLIKSLDIFMTPVINYSIIKADTNLVWPANYNSNSRYFEWPELINQSNYYLVHSLDFNYLVKNSGYTTDYNTLIIEPGNLWELTTKKLLPINQFTNHKLTAASLFNFNDRIHHSNTTTKFFRGFNPFWDAHKFGGVASFDSWVVSVSIKTDKGDRGVFIDNYTVYNMIVCEDAIGDIRLDWILTYPDKRANELWIGNGTTGELYKFSLTAHPILNLSYCIIGQDSSNIYRPKLWTTIGELWTNFYTFGAPNEPYLIDNNRLQVSGIINPFYLPAENSYRIGSQDNDIIKAYGVSAPISDGQYGEYPLYIFTEQGMWSLSQGQGSILYATINPLNRLVLNNKNGVVNIDGALIFTTDDGLYLITGGQLTEIGQVMEGLPNNYLLNNNDYQKYLNNALFVSLLNNISEDDFIVYIQGCIIAYDNINREIIISNNSYEYSYIYSLQSQYWRKSDEVFTWFVNNYPGVYGLKNRSVGDGQKLYDMTKETTDDVSVLIQTRPLKIGTVGFKSIERMLFQCYVNCKDLTIPGLHLFGSIDGNKYKYISGVMPASQQEFNDILIKRMHFSIRYLIIVFAAQVQDFQANALQISINDKYNNKLRG